MAAMPLRQLTLLSWSALVIVMTGVWWPHVAHFWVATPVLTTETIDELRRNPDDAALDTLAAVEFEPVVRGGDSRSAIAKAEDVLRGKWADELFGVRDLCVPFCARDLDSGWPTQQLSFASLGHVGLLLDGYAAGGDLRFLEGAEAVIGAFARYEQKAIISRGYLWNDHAIAQRVLEITRFWKYYRSSATFDPIIGRVILELVARSGRLLESPEHFTARTNHGLMQSLSLLHIAAAFPALPDSARFRDAAVQRLRMQLAYYQSGEGVVLEHSPGYHALGMSLFAALETYRKLLGPELAAEVDVRRARACGFFLDIVRPDWTLPAIGNTSAKPTPVRCGTSTAGGEGSADEHRSLRLYPVSGYAIAWSEAAPLQPASSHASQTVVAWGNFATRAHKHDDEMSVFTWLDGRPVLTGTGYWPYGHALQPVAVSWRGANAPHFDDETSRSARSTTLLAAGNGQGLTAVDLTRSSEIPGRQLRRQVVMLGDADWLIVDYAESNSKEHFNVLWTLAPGWRLEASGEKSFRAADSASAGTLMFSFASTGGFGVTTLSASTEPLGGYVAEEMSPRAIRPTTSIELRSGTGAPTVTRISAVPDRARTALKIGRWKDPAEWVVCLDSSCSDRVVRTGLVVSRDSGGMTMKVALKAMPSYDAEKKALNDAYGAASRRYPAWRDYYPWRKKATGWLLGGFVFQETLFLVGGRAFRTGKHNSGRTLLVARLISLLMWVGLGRWLVFTYFGQ